MHLTHVLCKLTIVEYSYQSINRIILLIGTIRSNYINFHKIFCSDDTINFENLLQLETYNSLKCILFVFYEKNTIIGYSYWSVNWKIL
jgi:hypothetical protein